MEYFNDQLVKGQINDPLFKAPLGGLLSHVAQKMRPVFIKYCENLSLKVAAERQSLVRLPAEEPEKLNIALGKATGALQYCSTPSTRLLASLL